MEGRLICVNRDELCKNLTKIWKLCDVDDDDDNGDIVVNNTFDDDVDMLLSCEPVPERADAILLAPTAAHS